MRSQQPQVVVAGHICLDIIPTMDRIEGSLEDILVPGKLIDVGGAAISTGGTVSNAGLALHRLGVPTALMGKVGNDLIGRAILDVLRSHGAALADGMILVKGEQSSYTIVINPPGVDRIFLHCPGANDTFGADDVAYDALAGVRLFHFGYPPLMRRLFIDGGTELATMLARVKKLGLTTSLDVAKPDPASPAGRVDWSALLRRVLPHVDVFLPSLDEILFMLDRPRLERMQEQAKRRDVMSLVDGALLAEISQRLLDLGVALAVLKLGDQGLYLRTTADRARLSNVGACKPAQPASWMNRELLAPCFAVEVVGTTGSGDCTIAGFLAALLKGLSPEEAMTAGVAVGACNVEKADATSGIVPWTAVQERIARGWNRRSVALSLSGWRFDEKRTIWVGPNDS